MKEIFRSGPYALENESGADSIVVYAVDSDSEWWALDAMTHNQRCDYCGVQDDAGYAVPPGALFYTYSFELMSNYFVMLERADYNV